MHLRALRPARHGAPSWAPPAWRYVTTLSALLMAFGIATLIVNPDFSSGDDSPLDRVLGFDVNGWHAMLLILLSAPGVIAGILEPEVAGAYAGAVAAALAVIGVVMLADTSTVALSVLPSEDANGILLLLLAGLYGFGAFLYARERRAAPERDVAPPR